jgi:TP901 family phage tail tape measure protein
LADKDLSVSIGVDLDFDEKAAAKKLDDVARRLGTNGEKMLKDLNIEINVTNIDKVLEKLNRLVASTEAAQEGLKKFNEDFSMLGALSTPGPAANAFYTRLRDGLGLTEKTNDALTRQLNIRQRIAKEIFDDPTQDFSVGRFVRPDNLKIKSYAKGQNNQVEKELKDFNTALEDALSDGLVSERELDDLRESGDLLSSSIMEINDAVEEFSFGSGEISDSLSKINNALAVAVQVAAVEIRDEFDLLPNAVMDKLDSSGKVAEDLQEGALDLAVILNKINDGFVLSEKELDKVKNIKFADVLNEDNVKTGIKPIIDAATFLSAYNKVLAENPLPTVGIGNIKREDKLTASKYEAKQFPKGVEQASDKVINSFADKLEKALDAPGGVDKATRRFEEIQTAFFDNLLQRALNRANSASRETFNEFEQDPVYGYAPNAIQPGKTDDANVGRRYVDEDVARFIYQEMLKAGLHPATFAALAPTTFSKKFGENIGVSEAGPANYNVQDVLRAARSASFPTGLGNQDIQQSPSGAGDLSVPAATFALVNQVLSNPAILRKLTNVTPDTLESRKSQAFNELTASNKGYPWKGIMKEATDLAYAIRFVERIKQENLDKPSSNDIARQAAIDATKAAAAAPRKPYVDTERSVAIADRQKEEAAAGDKAPRTLEEKAADKAYGQAQAKLIAQRRDRIRKDIEAFDKAWDEAHAEEARRNSGEPAVVESKPEIVSSVRKTVAKKVKAVEKQIETAAVEEVKDSGASASPGFVLKDNKALFREIIGREKALQGANLAVGVDAEFNEKIEQRITEFSAIFKNAEGKFQKLVDFIQMPLDPEGLASDRTPFGAKNADDLRDRATVLGYNAADIGDTGDVIQNQQVAAQNAKDISDLFEVLAEFTVPITGSNLSGAEAPKIKKFIEYGSNLAEALTGVGIPQPNVLKNTFDSATEYKRLDRNSDLASRLPSTPTGLAETKLQTILSMMAVEFKDLFDQYSSVVKMVQDEAGVDRPVFLSAAGGKMGAHYAQADAIGSIIARELFIKAAPAKDATRALGTAKPGSDGGGKPPAQPPIAAAAADDPMGERKASALARAFHSQYEYTKMLSGLTDNEKDVINRRLKMLAENDKQVAISAQLLEKEKAIAEKRASLRGMSPGSEFETTRQEIRALDGEINNLIETGRKNEAAIKQQVIEEGRHKDMKEQLRDNDRKGLDLEIEKNQAGKRFSAEIKAQVKEQIDAQKALQKANREQINQWVTGRYALYDVGNFYQNLAQQMFRLSRQIFDTTQTYRSFESAFTSVERAMQISGSAAVGMRDQFIALSETLPVTFEDLSKIATLGAQMGIGAGGIEEFTTTVAKFSAITTISADTVAQKFGRIAELAKIDSSEFENLGSAVAFAGVNAVATDSEILTLSESIAAVSKQAGFTGPEIIGMATALASVGVQAEQARGVATRVFADISRAASRGGSELDAFAKVSGMSSEDFAKQWGTEGQSYNVFRKLLEGLGSSSDMTKAFDSLNIVETREINTLTRLAKSLDVVDQANSDANQSFAEGTFLASSFEKTADNLDAQLVIFKNNVDSLVVSLSQTLGPALKGALELASGFIEVLKLGSKSGAAQWILPLGLGITAAGAAAFTAVAGFSKLIAQIYAFRVASINSMNSSATDIAGPINKIKQLTGAYSGLIEVRSGLGGVGGPEVKGLVTPVTFKASDIIGGQKEAFAEFAKTRSFASAMNIMNSTRENALLESANILMISTNKTQGISIGLARQQADAVQRIIDARRQEIAVMAEKNALNGFSESELLSQKFFIKLTKDGAEIIDDATAAQIRRTAATKGATAAQIQEAAAIRLVNAETQTATKAVGLGFTGILNKVTGLLGAVAIIGTVVAMVDMLRVSIEEANKIDLLTSGGSVQSLRDAMTEDTKIWRETGKAISTVKSEYEVYEPVVYAAYDAVQAVSGANKNLKSTTGEVTESVKNQTVAIGQNTKEWLLNSIVGNEKVNGWIEKNPDLFNEAESALKDYGTSFSDIIKTVLSNPENGQEVAIGKVTSAIDKNKLALIQRGRELTKINPSASLGDYLKDPAYLALYRRERAMQRIIALIPEMSSALNQGLNKSGFMASMKEAFDEAFGEDLPNSIVEGTQKAAKTLTQWSGEVAQIISSALEIRSQKTTALDNITKAWSDLRKKADDAKKAVKKAQDQINMLKASRSTLEYQLTIAIKYGDSKRATEIQAKLDENTTSLTDANDQLAQAQKSASTELKGNTDAAIDNRATLRSLVNTYVPYIQALENSTVKGETFAQKQDRIAAKVGVLKKEFESQALALGFAQKDLAVYLGDFDAMATIVKKVPDTVTVKIDGLPAALRALREFAVNANGELNKIKVDPKAYIVDSLNTQIAVLKLQAEAINADKSLSLASKRSALSGISGGISSIIKQIKEEYNGVVKYAAGGYVSGAGTGTSDSIPARLSNGEFVMSAKSVSNYGVDFMNSLNQSRVMYAPAQPSAAQVGGGSSVVYLSPDDRALLRAAIDRPVNLYADSTKLAQSVNNGNKVLAQRGSN